jgi:hypothetical protein
MPSRIARAGLWFLAWGILAMWTLRLFLDVQEHHGTPWAFWGVSVLVGLSGMVVSLQRRGHR